MISRILDFCIRERLVVLLLCEATVVYGWYCTRRSRSTRFPTSARIR